MNPTPDTSIPPAEDALRAASAVDDYVRQAELRGGSGCRTETFVEGAVEYSKRDDTMHGDQPPNQPVNKERPVHVLMCYMAAAGKTTAEIADKTGYTKEYVRQIQRQPWFRKRFLQLAAEAGKDEVKAFLGVETLASLEVLVEVRDNNNEKGATRVAAANAILDRALGKPTQKVESESHNYSHTASEASELDRQLAQAEAELKACGQPTVLSSGSN